MKTTEPIKFSIATLLIFSSCFPIVWTLYSGAWCPYKTEKVIPCRVRNGLERYYGPNLCWRNDNGSYACTKKILYRPRYTTTYKKVYETKYKCCPGRSGVNCENDCFNCTSYQRLKERVSAAERRLSRMEHPKPNTERSDRYHRDHTSQNSIYSAAPKDGSPDGSSLIYSALTSRVQKLLDEFRDLQTRIRLIENEMSRLNSQVDDLTLSNNNAYSYDRGFNSDKDRNNKDSPEADSGANSSNHKSLPSSTSSVSSHEGSHSVKAGSSFRVLEENLERGDIASTLNDDYGDELYSDNSTEQYIDQLQLKRENSP